MKKLLSLPLLLIAVFTFGQNWGQKGQSLVGGTSQRKGSSVAISASGNVIAVSSDGGLNNVSGRAEVRTWNGSSWVTSLFLIDGASGNEAFGQAVSLSADGTVFAVGDNYHFGGVGPAGGVAIWKFDGQNWNVLGDTIYGDDGDDEFGGSICLSGDGNTIAVGAIGHDGSGSYSGQVKVFTFNGSDWVQKGSDFYGGTAWDNYGKSVALDFDGDVLAIGKPGHSSTGKVELYRWNSNAWALDEEWIGPSSSTFGTSVSLSDDGNSLAVGNPYYDSGSSTSIGRATVYDYNGTNWTQSFSVNGNAARWNFGSSIGISGDGNAVAIGGIGDGSVPAVELGYAEVYKRNGIGGWNQIGNTLTGDPQGSGDTQQFGYSIDIDGDGNTTVVGEPRFYAGGSAWSAGKARIFLHCPDDTTFVNQIACGSYTWNTNGQTYTADGNYTVTLTTADGCDSIVTLILDIDDTPLNLTIDQGPISYICNNGSWQLEALSPIDGLSYSWYKDGVLLSGETDSVLTVSAIGDYFVTTTYPAGGCEDTSAVTTVYNNTVYPNASILQGDTMSICPNGTVEILAATGTDYSYSWTFGGQSTVWDTMSNYVASNVGVYYVDVSYHNCFASDSVVVISEAEPTISFSSASSCPGPNVLLTANVAPGNSVVWNDGTVGTTIQMSNVNEYVAIVTDVNTGCTSSATFQTDLCYCLDGSYTVGASGDIPTLEILQNMLDSACSMTGTVTFNFLPGTYVATAQAINVSGVPGNTFDNRLVFQSATGDPNDVIIEFSTYNGVSNTGFVDIRNMTFNETCADNPHFVISSTGHIRVDNCVLNANNCADGVSLNDGEVTRCTITNAENGIYILNTRDDCKAEENTITDYSISGITVSGSGYIPGSDTMSVRIRQNSLSTETADAMGIRVGYSNNTLVEQNFINQKTGTGITVGKGTYIMIRNNMISLRSSNTLTSATSSLGIELYTPSTYGQSSDRVYIYNNTVSAETRYSTNSEGKAIALQMSVPGNTGRVNIRNNIFLSRDVCMFARNVSSAAQILDHNIYFQTGSAVQPFRYGSSLGGASYEEYPSLQAWSTSWIAQDQHSTWGNPNLVSTSSPINLHLQSISSIAANAGDTCTAVFNDFDGAPRLSGIDIGADEITLPDLEVTDLSSTQSTCEGSAELLNDTTLTVTVINEGTGSYPTGTEIVFTCTVNGLLNAVETVLTSQVWGVGQSLSHTFTSISGLSSIQPNEVVVSISNVDQNFSNNSISTFVGNLPNPTAAFSVTNACQGGSVFDNTSSTSFGTLTYVWDFGDGGSSTATDPTYGQYSNAGNYDVSLIATTNYGCSDTAEVSIDVLESPTVTLNAFDAVCINHGPITLSGGIPAGGTYSGTGVSNNIFNPTTAGSGSRVITYTVVGGNGCEGSDTQTILVNPCTGVSEVSSIDFKLFPNPADEMVFIEYDEINVDRISVYNPLGQLVVSITPSRSGRSNIDVSEFSGGVYLIQMEAEGEYVWKRLVIK